MKLNPSCGIATLLQWILLLYAGIALAPSAQAGGNQPLNIRNDYLLVVNSYTSDAPWSNAIIEPVEKWVSTEHGVAVFVEHLNMLMVEDTAQFERVMRTVLDKYPDKAPKAVLLLGNPALLLRDDLRGRWGDVPVVLCAEEDYFGPDEAYIGKRPIPVGERAPLATLADAYNLTFLQTKMFPRENVELLRRMIPGLKEVLLIGDGRYVNQQLDYDMQRLMAREYPELGYRFLSAADLSLEELMAQLETADASSTGVLFSSWFRKSDLGGSPVLNANSFRVIANLSVPVFALKRAVMDNSNMIGGCFPDGGVFKAHLRQALFSVLENPPPREIAVNSPATAAAPMS